jgi:hypothetical protein
MMGQEEESPSFLFIPSEININVGETQKVLIKLVDKNQNPIQTAFTIYSANDPGIGPTPDWPGTSINITPRVSDSTGVAEVTIQPRRSGKLLLKVRSLNGFGRDGKR